MVVKERNRGGMKGHTTVKSDKKVKYNFDLSVLELMCSYVMSQNANIRRGNLINMRNLFDAIDLNIYNNNPEKMKRIEFIQRGLEARLEQDLRNPALILTYINGGIISDENTISENFDEISNEELEYIDQTVSVALQNTFIDKRIEEFNRLYTAYNTSDYRYREEIVKEFEEFVFSFANDLRRSRAVDPSATHFSLVDETFENVCSDIHDRVTAPGRFLYCTMQGVNAVVGGGFEATRVYLIAGMGGIGKSMLMLNLALQFKKANKGYITKDPTKIPTILFLTQENTVDETVERIFNMITNDKMSNYSKEDVMRILREDGELIIEGDNNINIDIMYRPDRSIDTGELYTIVEDLEEDGYEVIALFQDHIKRIRSVDRSVRGDIRLELGFVMNEMKTFAQIKEIPVITVTHLNRDAAKTIDSSTQGNKTDLTRLLGRSNIGESMLMFDNADCVLLANKEYDFEENAYLVLFNTKLRNNAIDIDYVCQPFAKNSQTKLVEDLFMPAPVYKTTLVPEEQQAPPIQMQGMTIKASPYTNIEKIGPNQEENIFSSLSGSKYSSEGMNNSIDSNKILDGLLLPKEPISVITWNKEMKVSA